MPRIIPNTATQNTYVEATTFQGTDVFARGFLFVANNAVFAQLIKGLHGLADYSPEHFLPPGIYPATGGSREAVMGVRFRSAVAGVPGRVFGILYYPGEASIDAGTEYLLAV